VRLVSSVTDETSEPRIWTEINNLIAAITL